MLHTVKGAGLKEEFHIGTEERQRQRDGYEFARHRAPVVVAPDCFILANLGKGGAASGSRSRTRRSRKLSWWLDSGRKVTNSDCHSAHCYGRLRSGITTSEPADECAGWPCTADKLFLSVSVCC